MVWDQQHCSESWEMTELILRLSSELHQQVQICKGHHTNGRKRRGTKEPLDESLSKLRELGREAWRAAVHGVAKSRTGLRTELT